MLSGSHRYYEGSDYCSRRSSLVCIMVRFPCPDARPRTWFFGKPDIHENWQFAKDLRPSREQFSLLISFELRTIPSPSTACHFATIALTRYFTVVACRVYPPGRR